jgi:hypothetical protein
MNNLFIRIIRKILSQTGQQSFKHDDVFLVEFPKSGVTWLSFLIANSLLKNSDENVTFFNHHKYVADIHQIRNSKISDQYPLHGYRFIKSHHKSSSSYYFVVYLLRNPFDVMMSYYNFMQSSGYKDSFEQFVLSKQYGIQNWVEHVEGWLLTNKDLAQRIHVIRYEDLIADSAHELANLFANLGLVVDESKIHKAIDSSSKELMKDSERLYKKFNPVYKKSNMNFVRKCRSSQEDTSLSKSIIKTIYNKSNHLLEIFYKDKKYSKNDI